MADPANMTFSFELVSPEQKLIDTPAWQVVVPGEEGEVGVRAGHMALVVAMKPGVVQIWRGEGSEPVKIFIAGGFADIAQEHCTILAEEAFDMSKLEPSKLTQELQNLNDDLRVAENDLDRARIKSRQSLISAMLDALAA